MLCEMGLRGTWQPMMTDEAHDANEWTTYYSAILLLWTGLATNVLTHTRAKTTKKTKKQTPRYVRSLANLRNLRLEI